MEFFVGIFVCAMLASMSISLCIIANYIGRITTFFENNKQEVFAYLRNISTISEHTHEIRGFIKEDRNEAKEYKRRINSIK